ncbi:MAG: hypothetical protein EZS28_038357, partial [Streblomastix strix]
GFIEMADVESAQRAQVISLIVEVEQRRFYWIQLNQLQNLDQRGIILEVSKTPKALHSLITLSIYKIGTHLSQENDQQTLAIRSGSRECLLHIQQYGDASDQSELVNANYSKVLVIAINTASGSGEEEDDEIFEGLNSIFQFLGYLIQGRNYSATFQPQPLLARRSNEQIEEEGGNEEIDSQLINKGKGSFWSIKNNANGAKGWILNYFIEQSNQRPG